MRFTVLPVHSLEDATLDLEQLQALLTTPSGQSLPFLQLLTAQNLQLALGSGSVTFTASAQSAGTVITHGLGRVPKFVAAFCTNGNAIYFFAGALTSTQATFTGGFISATSGTFPFAWLAIG